MWKSFEIALTQAKISGKEKGSGEHVLICIHGYLQDKHLFDRLWEKVPDNWIIVCIDMPLFGRSEWKKKHKPMNKKFLRKMWASFRQRYPNKELNLLGFSMGGKMAMNLVGMVKDPPENVILISPDGISRNVLQNFAMFNPLGKQVLKGFLRFPAPIIYASRFAYRLKLIDRFTHDFMYGNFGSAKLRKALRTYMLVYSGLKVPLKKLQKRTQEHQIKWQIIWGRQDGIISSKGIQRFQKLIPEAQGDFIETGHLVVDLKPKEVRKLLNQFLELKGKDMVSPE
ncbi:MAG: alpha/beta fold hydrolase [Bacteroidia bacterium]|nr:alpha/beta fold hydrolase [Bacteroidia bacterium]